MKAEAEDAVYILGGVASGRGGVLRNAAVERGHGN